MYMVLAVPGSARGETPDFGEFVSLELAVSALPLRDQLAAIDRHLGREELRLDGFGMLGELQVGDDDHGHLIFVGQVEGFDGANQSSRAYWSAR